MREGFLSDSLFRKNKEAIYEKNYKALLIGGAAYIVVSLVEMLAYLLFNPEALPDFMLIYSLIVASFMVLLKATHGIRKEVVTVAAVVWYMVAFAFICTSRFYHPDEGVLLNQVLLTAALSVAIMLPPISMIVVHSVGLCAILVTDYIYNGFVIVPMNFTRYIIAYLICAAFGIAALYFRMENYLFAKELFNFTEGVDDDFVDKSTDSVWSKRTKYGILSGKIQSHRKSFTFVFSLSKEKLTNIRKYNIWKLEAGMNWKEAREYILETCLDPVSCERVSQLLDPDYLYRCHKVGKARNSIIAGFNLSETEIYWFNMECTVKQHPITGELFAAVSVEDITEDRILMGVLNKLVEQHYDFVMCIERNLYRTIYFRVNEGEEIKGVYGDTYETELNSYLERKVSKRDWQKIRSEMAIETICAALDKDNRYELLVNEKDPDGKIHKSVFQYSYLDPMHNFLCATKKEVTDIIEKEDAAKARLSAALKEREEAMNAQSEFMTRMSHEMRTPMNAILGLSALMQDEVNNPDAMRDYIAKIRYSGEFLLQLINDVLDITKFEQDKFTLNMVPYTFAEFWEAIDTMIGPMCLRKGVDFEWKSSISGDRVIITDPLRITQLAINLLSNAVKYTPAGGKVIFECKEHELDNNKVRIALIVKDDGIGMSQEFQEHMFEPFTQESKEIRNELNGTGLGLSIVKGIVDALGGKISVKSELGKGSTFRVSFDAMAGETVIRERQTAESTDISGMRILIVEDNDINREIAVALMEKKGAMTEVAVNGQEAVEMFASRAPFYYDLILMDIRMPVMSGLTATKRIRAMERDDAASIPILAMTANAFGKDAAASFDAGMNEHLVKPIDPKLVYKTIAKYKKS